MKDVNHALDIIGRKLSMTQLAFADDQLGIAVMPDLDIYLTRLDDQTIEASCQLDGLDYPDAAMMRAMLEANFLGGATGPARLSLDADKSEVVLCECWTVTDYEAAAIERRFDAFVAAAMFWKGEGTAILLEQAATLRMEDAPDDLHIDETEDEGDPPIVMRL